MQFGQLARPTKADLPITNGDVVLPLGLIAVDDFDASGGVTVRINANDCVTDSTVLDDNRFYDFSFLDGKLPS